MRAETDFFFFFPSSPNNIFLAIIVLRDTTSHVKKKNIKKMSYKPRSNPANRSSIGSVSSSYSSSGYNKQIAANTNGNRSESETSRIRVLIRVRPLNNNEISRKHKCVLQPQRDQQLTVWDPACFDVADRAELADIDPNCWSRNFTFDKCLWSLDEEDENFASQDTVFAAVGEPVLNLVLDGFNCCVFAYGQVNSN